MLSGFKRVLLGRPRDVLDPGVFHKVSLAAFLAWVGLGADGLSSSAYGPEEAFKALGPHGYLAVAMAGAIALTVFICSYAYSLIIEHFPFGGGGYVVATRLLGRTAGVVSGSALIVDYVLTIAISIAAGVDAVFSFLPPAWQGWKLAVAAAAIGVLTLLNLRGLKDSVAILAPVLLPCVVTRAMLILGTLASRSHEIPSVLREIHVGFAQGLRPPLVGLGLAGMLALFMRAYSLGGGTYTGIEAVSNGLSIMREPKVQTGKRTMLLMAVSLALTASGILLAYLLVHATPEAGRTMNAVLANQFAGDFRVGSWAVGAQFVLVTLASEACLLFVAAQAGFIDGPRVMANMSTDSWLPHRFAQLSDRLTMQNGVLLMSGAALLALWYTRGAVDRLVVMYSINVFLTFSLTELSMCRFWLQRRKQQHDWRRQIAVHVAGLVLCATILTLTTYEKFAEGGWLTLGGRYGGGGRRRGAVYAHRAGIPVLGVLPRQARVRRRNLGAPHPAQRDRIPDAAAPPVRGPERHGSSGAGAPLRGVNAAAFRVILPNSHVGSNARLVAPRRRRAASPARRHEAAGDGLAGARRRHLRRGRRARDPLPVARLRARHSGGVARRRPRRLVRRD